MPDFAPLLDQLRLLVASGELSSKDLRDFLVAHSNTTSSPEADQALTLDLDRAQRCGYPEVVYGPGKSPELVVAAAKSLLERNQDVLVTRVDTPQQQALANAFPQGQFHAQARTWRCVSATNAAHTSIDSTVAVVTAGSSDLPVAAEAEETLEWMRVKVKRIRDVGVAGPHRLIERVAELRQCDAIVVVAGMEGALPSVVAGHVDCPVIGVPTSVGYGANFQGVSALLSMLNSCAANVVVVNIDAGFKGGYVAGMIASRVARGRGNRE